MAKCLSKTINFINTDSTYRDQTRQPKILHAISDHVENDWDYTFMSPEIVLQTRSSIPTLQSSLYSCKNGKSVKNWWQTMHTMACKGFQWNKRQRESWKLMNRAMPTKQLRTFDSSPNTHSPKSLNTVHDMPTVWGINENCGTRMTMAKHLLLNKIHF